MSIENFKIMNNIRTLRALARSVPFELLKEFLEKLTVVVEERQAEVSQEEAQKKERAQLLQEYHSMLAKKGFKVEELLELAMPQKSQKRSKREKRPAKYCYLDEKGQERTWTGQGRMPAIMDKLIRESSKTKGDFLINEAN